MLGLSNATELNEQLWQALASRTELPEQLVSSLHRAGSDAVKRDCQRQFARKPLRAPAILIDGDIQHACHAKDISRIGVGFYAPQNLLPKKVVRLWLPHGGIFVLRVVRCRRLGERCYEVGTRFHAAVEK